jgi:3-hydroxybutyryl-CoA dehydrogenase
MREPASALTLAEIISILFSERTCRPHLSGVATARRVQTPSCCGSSNLAAVSIAISGWMPRSSELSQSFLSDWSILNIKTIGVIGAGTMGSGVAEVAATARFNVLLHDICAETLKATMECIKEDLRQGVTDGRLSTIEATEALARIHPRRDFDALQDADFVIEAAVEKLDVKQDILSKLDQIVAPHVILATTTSSLSVGAIASAIETPESVVGMHFINPPHAYALVEIVHGELTSDEAIKTAYDLAISLQKVPIICTDTPGFLVNRISRPFFGEALLLFDEGVASVAEIDRIVKLEGRFKTGPFERLDFIGIDVDYALTVSLYERFRRDPRFAPHPIQRKMAGSGTVGRKSRKGFYIYK